MGPVPRFPQGAGAEPPCRCHPLKLPWPGPAPSARLAHWSPGSWGPHSVRILGAPGKAVGGTAVLLSGPAARAAVVPSPPSPACATHTPGSRAPACSAVGGDGPRALRGGGGEELLSSGGLGPDPVPRRWAGVRWGQTLPQTVRPHPRLQQPSALLCAGPMHLAMCAAWGPPVRTPLSVRSPWPWSRGLVSVSRPCIPLIQRVLGSKLRRDGA